MLLQNSNLKRLMNISLRATGYYFRHVSNYSGVYGQKKKKNKGSKHKKRCTKYMQIPRTKTSRFRRPRNRVYHTHPGSAGFCQNAHDFGFVRAPVIHPHPNHRHRATPSAGSATTWWGFTIAGTGCDRSERYIIIFHTFRNYIPETFALVTPRRRGGVLLWRSRQ